MVSSFNPRPRAGGDPDDTRLPALGDVSIHAPARGATRYWLNHGILRLCFNPRPRAGGRLSLVRFCNYLNLFQSTPPRGGATACVGRGLNIRIVSIHAPARGGDGKPVSLQDHRRVSIHAPARGGDFFPRLHSSHNVCFNPRPRAGGRLAGKKQLGRSHRFQSTPPRGGATYLDIVLDPTFSVSIHAPARGGDLIIFKSTTVKNSFNPRPRAGGRHPERSRVSSGICFNPRPRAGGRRRSPKGILCSMAFQSTPPRGGATPINVFVQMDGLFQSTPPRGGATKKKGALLAGIYVSIHAPARGGDPMKIKLKSDIVVSIHAPARGGDCFYSRDWFCAHRFQSTPPRGGATVSIVGIGSVRTGFNPRPRAGGRLFL